MYDIKTSDPHRHLGDPQAKKPPESRVLGVKKCDFISKISMYNLPPPSFSAPTTLQHCKFEITSINPIDCTSGLQTLWTTVVAERHLPFFLTLALVLTGNPECISHSISGYHLNIDTRQFVLLESLLSPTALVIGDLGI